MLANRVREFTTTVGTGDITLGGAFAGYARFTDAFTVGESVVYVIEDGDNYEIGQGTLTAADTLERTNIEETLEGGVLVKTGASPLTLSGNARVYCAVSAKYLLDPTKEADVIREITPDAGVSIDSVVLKDGHVTAPAGAAFQGDVSITGNLDVKGELNTQIGNDVFIGDTIVTLNAELPSGAAPTMDAGIEVNRGSEAKQSFVWNETSDTWQASAALNVQGAGTFAGDMIVVSGPLTGVAQYQSSVQIPDTDGNRGGFGVQNDSGGVLAGIAAQQVTGGGYPSSVGQLDLWVQNAESSNIATTFGADKSATFNGRIIAAASDTDYQFEIRNSPNQPYFLRNLDTSGNFAVHLNGLGDILSYSVAAHDWDFQNTSLVDIAGITVTGDISLNQALTFSGTGAWNTIKQAHNTGSLYLNGGNTAGANLQLCGSGHATANDFLFRVDATPKLQYDWSANIWNYYGTDISNVGKLTVGGGAKISVQNKQDGGPNHGIFLYDTDNSNYGIYLATAGDNRSLADATSCSSLDGRSGHLFRFRSYDGNGNAFVWENGSEQCLMSLTADTGDLYTKGNINVSGDGYFRDNTAGRIVLDNSSVADGSQPMKYIRSVGGELAIGTANRNAFGGTTGSVDLLKFGIDGAANFQGNDLIGIGTRISFQSSGALNVPLGSTLSLQRNGVNGLTFDGASWDFKGNDLTNVGTIRKSNPYIERDYNDSTLHLSGGNVSDTGSNLILYGGTHTSNADDILFRASSTAVLRWDNSAGGWFFQDTWATDFASISRGTNNDKFNLSGGSNISNGGNIVMYGESHSSLANNIYLRSGGTNILSWNDSSGHWHFYANPLVQVTAIRRGISSSELMLSGGSGSDNLGGGGIRLFGEGHATRTNDIEFHTEGAAKLTWDNSADYWNFQGNDLTGVGNLTISGTNIIRSIDTSNLSLSGGNVSNVGAGIDLFGSAHPTLANDILFRVAAVTRLQWEDSSSVWNFQGNDLTGVDKVLRGTATDLLQVSGGSGGSIGGNIALYGESHSSFANDIILRQGTNSLLQWNNSADEWNFHSKNVADLGRVRLGGSPRTDWASSYETLEAGLTGVAMGSETGNGLWVGANWYYDGAYKYRTSGPAVQTYHKGDTGEYILRTAPSGTAGTAITWTEALRISNAGTITTAGDVLVGDSSLNGLSLDARSTGDAPRISARGPESNIALQYSTKGGGNHNFYADNFNDLILTLSDNLTATFTGKLAVDGGAKISVQNKADGGSGNGLFWYDTDNQRYGSYMAQAGAAKSLSDDSACASLDGRTSWHIRNRIASSASEGYIWENHLEQCLMSLTADTGDLHTKGNIFCGGGFIAALNGGMTGQSSIGSVGVAGGAGLSVGGNIVCYAQGHPTQANDIAFRTGTAVVGAYDASANAWGWSAIRFTGVGDVSMSGNDIHRSAANDALRLSGGTTTNLGGNIRLFGENHSNQANDIVLRANQNEILRWDNSANYWDFRNTELNFVDSVFGGTSTGVLQVGGTSSGVGGNLMLFGNSHATAANDIALRSNTTDRLRWDNSANYWNFQGNDVSGVSQLEISGNVDNSSNALLDLSSTSNGDVNFVKFGTTAWQGIENTGGLFLARNAYHSSVANQYFGGPTTSDYSNIVELPAASSTTSTVFRVATSNATVTADAIVPVTDLFTIRQDGVTNFQGNGLTGADSLVRGFADDDLRVSGGSSVDAGANILMHGEGHSTNANGMFFRAGAAYTLIYDHSITTWNFQETTITNVSDIQISAAGNAALLTIQRSNAGSAGSGLGNIEFINNTSTLMSRINSSNGTSTSASVLKFSVRNATDGLTQALEIKEDKSSVFEGAIVANSRVNMGSPAELTISSGAITITKAFHTVDTEGDAALDELTAINGGSEGDILILTPAHDSRTVRVKDGGLLLAAGDFDMDTAHDKIAFIKVGADWHELFRSNNA